MRKLIEEKLESAENELARKNQEISYTITHHNLSNSEFEDLMDALQQLNGVTELLKDLLNSKELSEMEAKVEKYDEIKHIHEREMESTIDSYDKTLEKYEREIKVLKDGIKEIFNLDNLEWHIVETEKKVYVNAYDLHSDYEDNDYGGNEYPYLVDKDGKIKAILEVIEDDRN